jgi:threonine synthase
MSRLEQPWYKIIDLASNTPQAELSDNPAYFFSHPDIDIQYTSPEINSTPFKPHLPPHQHYSHLLPISKQDTIITLGEGNTDLISSRSLYKSFGLHQLFFKHEGQNPTGSFKDRGSVIEIAKAIKYQAKQIVVASTGNMAASISAYAAAAGIPCQVVIPKNTPRTKLAQSLFYGAKIQEVSGGYDEASLLATQIATTNNFYLAGDYSFRAEGQKSQAYEIIEQLNFKAPDWVIVPVGNGTNFYAIWKGFKELFQLKKIRSLPKMLGVQTESFDAVYRHFKHIPANQPASPTVATAIAVKKPTDLSRALAAVTESKGDLISIPDQSILPAQLELARSETLLVEPSSATVLVALQSAVSREIISSTSTVVCLITGHGYKDLNSAVQLL